MVGVVGVAAGAAFVLVTAATVSIFFIHAEPQYLRVKRFDGSLLATNDQFIYSIFFLFVSIFIVHEIHLTNGHCHGHSHAYLYAFFRLWAAYGRSCITKYTELNHRMRIHMILFFFSQSSHCTESTFNTFYSERDAAVGLLSFLRGCEVNIIA